MNLADDMDLQNISKIFRYSFLARELKISIKELIEFIHLSDLDPIGEQSYSSGDNYSEPDLLKFVRLAHKIKDSDFDLQQIDFLIRHLDLTGNSGPSEEGISSLLFSIRSTLGGLDENFSLQNGFDEELVYELFLTVYGQQIADLIFATINGRPDLTFSVDYTHTDIELAQNILDVDPGLQYRNLENKLVYQGIMPSDSKTSYDGLSGTSAQFGAAIQELFDQGQTELQRIVDLYPEVQGLYDQSVSLETAIAQNIDPVLRRLKVDSIMELLSTSLDVEKEELSALLTSPISPADQFVINSSSPQNEPALNDLISLDGLGADFEVWHDSTIGGAADDSGIHSSGFNFSPGTVSLPSNPTAGDPVSIRWNFMLEAGSNGFHSFFVDADAGANISLIISDQDMDMQQLSTGQWKNNNTIALSQGQFYPCTLEASNITDQLVMRWKSIGTLMEEIPPANLMPKSYYDFAGSSYIRLLKALQISEILELSSEEITHLVQRTDMLVGGTASMLSQLPVG